MLPLAEGVGEEMARPSCSAFRWFAASQCRETRFGFAVELAVPVLPAWSIMERRFDTFQSCALPQPLDGGAADLDGFSDLGSAPFLLLGTAICFQQDASTGDGTGRGCARLDRSLEEEALGSGKRNDVEFCQREALLEVVR